MRTLLPFVVIGLTSGSIYGLAGVGLVLTYKTSGVFNFAHGAMASLGAYAFYTLRTEHGVAWPLAALICVAVVGPVAGVLLERLGRELAGASSAMRIVATVGLLLAVQGTLQLVYGPSTRRFEPFLPQDTFRAFDVVIGWDQVIVVGFVAAATLGLALFFRRSRLGVAMRAAVGDPDLLELSGTDTILVGRLAWMIGTTFAVVSGVLIAPSLGLDTLLLTLLVVQAFGAAAVGRFEHLATTYLGGLGIGIAAALSQRYVTDIPVLVGLPASLPFVVLFAGLLLARVRRVEEPPPRKAGPAGSSLGPAWTAGGMAALLVAACVAPFAAGARLPVYTQGLTFVLVFLSLGLLLHTSGQLSLCHAGFVAVGAAAFGHLAGLPWLLAVVGAGLVTVPIGAIIAIPAIRLSGVYLALATFGFGVLLQRMAYPTALMFGKDGARAAPRPDLAWMRSDRGFYFVVLLAVIAGAALVAGLRRTRLGRLLRAMADSPVGLAAQGAEVNTTRVLVFCLAAFLAGVAGALFSAATGSADGQSYGPFVSLLWLTLLAVSGRALLRGAVTAAMLLTVLPAYIGGDIAEYQLIVFGSLAMLAGAAAGTRVPLGLRLDGWIAAAEDRPARGPVRARVADTAWRGPSRGRAEDLTTRAVTLP